jgi:hypothetical protein
MRTGGKIRRVGGVERNAATCGSRRNRGGDREEIL